MGFAIVLLNLLPGLLIGIPGISARLKTIIGDVAGAGAVLLSSGVINAPNVNTILAAWAGVITTLKSDPGLPQDKLTLIDELEKIVASALLEDQQALLGVNWAKFAIPTANV